jgi:hypothetical protein
MKSCIFVTGLFPAFKHLVITFSTVKSLCQVRAVWLLTFRNELGLQKVKKSWEIFPKLQTIKGLS